VNRRFGAFGLGGLLVALLLAGVVSSFASSAPDGLDSVARRGCTFDADGRITGGNCMAAGERDSATADSPLADYGVRGVDNPYLSTGLSGVLGVLVTFAVAGGLVWLARRRPPSRDATPAGAATPAVAPGE
jgi:cobalt/nickel transport protein